MIKFAVSVTGSGTGPCFLRLMFGSTFSSLNINTASSCCTIVSLRFNKHETCFGEDK